MKKEMNKTIAKDEFNAVRRAESLKHRILHEEELLSFMKDYRRARFFKSISNRLTKLINFIVRIPINLVKSPVYFLKACTRFYYRRRNLSQLITNHLSDTRRESYHRQGIKDDIWELHRYLGILPDKQIGADSVLMNPVAAFYEKPEYARKVDGKFQIPADFTNEEYPNVFIHKKWSKKN